MKPKKQLIYILGSQRSGTTALEYVLSTNSSLFALGEVRLLNKFIRNDPSLVDSRGRCTCGVQVADCAFWSPVLASVSQQLRVDNKSLYKDVDSPKADRGEAIRQVRALYERLSADSERILIDSSKTLSYLRLLYEALPDWNICVVHVVRDPLQVVLSSLKWKERHFGESNSPHLLLLGWLRAQLGMMSWLSRRQRMQCLELRYESFVQDPLASLQRISAAFSLKQEFQLSLNLRGLHTIAGTPSRFRVDEFQLEPKPMKNVAEADRAFRLIAGLVRGLYQLSSFLWRR